MAIDRRSDEPVYRQIARELAASIVREQFGPDGRLPTEQQLTERYGVSRITIRQAMDVLDRQNLILRRRAKGTFARKPQVRADLQQFGSFYESIAQQGFAIDTELLAFRRIRPPKRVARALRCERSLFLARKYVVEGTTLGITSIYLPPLAFGITREQAERQYTFSLLEHTLGYKIGRSDLAIRAESARGTVPAELGVRPNEAVLVMERIAYSRDDEPLEHSTIYLKAHAYQLCLSVTGPVPLRDQIRRTGDEPRNRVDLASPEKRGAGDG